MQSIVISSSQPYTIKVPDYLMIQVVHSIVLLWMDFPKLSLLGGPI